MAAFILAGGLSVWLITFAVVDATVLRPLPLPHSARVIALTIVDVNGVPVTHEVYRRLAAEVSSVEVVAARSSHVGIPATVSGVKGRLAVAYSSTATFTLGEWSPVLGRFWTESEETDKAAVAVITNELWQRLGASPAVLGETVTIGAQPYSTIGVLPPTADQSGLDVHAAQLWLPLAGDSFAVYARLREGTDPRHAAKEIEARLENPDWKVSAMPLIDTYTAPVRRWMLLALVTAGLLTLVACLNSAIALWARTADRMGDIGVRAALGASWQRLSGVALLQSAIHSATAAVLALLISSVGIHAAKYAILSMLPGIFRADDIALGSRAVVAAAILAAVTCISGAVGPIWIIRRASPAVILGGGAAYAVKGRARWRRALLAVEIAAVTVLLVICSLVSISLRRVLAVELGIDVQGLVAVMPRLSFKAPVSEIQQRIGAVAGVRDVAVSTGASLPIFGRAFGGAWRETTLSVVDGDRQVLTAKALDYRVSANYFSVAGIRFVAGQAWLPRQHSVQRTVVIDERLARALFQRSSPIGRVVRRDDSPDEFTIAGIVRFVPARGPDRDALPSAYFPQTATPKRTFAGLLVRTSAPEESVVREVERALESWAPDQDEPYIFSASRALWQITSLRRFTVGVTVTLAVISVVVVLFGVHATITSWALQQTRSNGIRMALGATPSRVLYELATALSRPVAAGLGAGLIVAWWLSQGFTAVLFEVTAVDLRAYLVTVVGVTTAAIVAAVLAGWRPAHAEPIVALRYVNREALPSPAQEK